MVHTMARVFFAVLTCADAIAHEKMHMSDWDKETKGMHVVIDTYASW